MTEALDTKAQATKRRAVREDEISFFTAKGLFSNELFQYSAAVHPELDTGIILNVFGQDPEGRKVVPLSYFASPTQFAPDEIPGLYVDSALSDDMLARIGSRLTARDFKLSS